MRDKHKEKVIAVALDEYDRAVCSNSATEIARVVHMMENVWIMCVPFSIKGFDRLDAALKEAREKYKNILS